MLWWETRLALMINLTENKGQGHVRNNSQEFGLWCHREDGVEVGFVGRKMGSKLCVGWGACGTLRWR